MPTLDVTTTGAAGGPTTPDWDRLDALERRVRQLQSELTRCYAELDADAGRRRPPPRSTVSRFQHQDAVAAAHPPLTNVALNPREAQALESVFLLTNVMEARDPYTAGHSRRVAYLARLIGEALRWPSEQVEMLEWAGLLHDVGKIGIPESILQKNDRLTPTEWAHIQRHPRLSHDLLKPVAGLKPVLDGVLHHHENLDGTGYPDRLKGEAIPPAARILRVADTFDALTSSRPYRARLTVEQALAHLRKATGKAIDPIIAEVFEQALQDKIAAGDANWRALFPHLQFALLAPEVAQHA